MVRLMVIFSANWNSGAACTSQIVEYASREVALDARKRIEAENGKMRCIMLD